MVEPLGEVDVSGAEADLSLKGGVDVADFLNDLLGLRSEGVGVSD